jgi:hypothetical protein
MPHIRTGEIKESLITSFAIANFKDNAKFFHDLQLKHWKVEIKHFYKDKALNEDLNTANAYDNSKKLCDKHFTPR